MKSIQLAFTLGLVTVLSACASKPASKPKSRTAPTQSSSVKPMRITHIDQQFGAQELMFNTMSLIGTPYKYGGSNTSTGFDCSGMIQFVYKNALDVNLPRTARDLVFYNTGSPYSHVGLYIGNGEFIHAPSSRGTIRTEKMSSPYFAKRFTKAGTFF